MGGVGVRVGVDVGVTVGVANFFLCQSINIDETNTFQLMRTLHFRLNFYSSIKKIFIPYIIYLFI